MRPVIGDRSWRTLYSEVEPAQHAAHPGFTILLFLASWPFASRTSRCRHARPSARMERNDFGVLSTSSLISSCSQLQFRSAASSCQPTARVIFTNGEPHTPFHAEPTQHEKERYGNRGEKCSVRRVAGSVPTVRWPSADHQVLNFMKSFLVDFMIERQVVRRCEIGSTPSSSMANLTISSITTRPDGI